MNLNTSAKRILVFGDSIAYGRVPKLLDRYGVDIRWTGVLQKQLGENYAVIEEGLRARMLSGANPNFQDRDGSTQFGPILGSHLPLDLILISLGTNDMNESSHNEPKEIAGSLDNYFQKIKWWVDELQVAVSPKVLIIAPPHIDESVLNADTIFRGGGAKSMQIASLYEAKAKGYDAYFFDAAKYVTASRLDGVHLDENNNKILATELAVVVRSILV